MEYTDAIHDFTIGLMALVLGFSILWLLTKVLHRQTARVSLRIEPPVEPLKFKGMIIIEKNAIGEYFTKTVAGNYETLQHGEGIKTKQSLRKHIDALAKATNSAGLIIKDKTGDFPDLDNHKQ